MSDQQNSFAVIETGGKQYMVQEGQILDFERLNSDSKNVEFSQVLLVSQNGDLKMGKPYLDQALVKGEVLEEVKADKKIAFKFKTKIGYKKTIGHRQKHSRVRITGIQVK